MKRALILWLAFLTQALPVGGTPQWVNFQASHFRGLNTVIFVQAGLSARPKHLKLRLLRVGTENGPDEEVHVYTIEDGHPVGAKFLRDYDNNPLSIRVRTVEFLPLGIYRVEVSDSRATIQSDPVDTRDFPLALRKEEKNRESTSFLRSIEDLAYGPDEMDELLAGRRVAPVSLLAPVGMVSAKDLRFRWKSGKARVAEYVLYIFDDHEVVWSGWSRSPGIVFKGWSRRLDPGHTYYWVVGGRSTDSLLVCDSLQKFVVERRP